MARWYLVSLFMLACGGRSLGGVDSSNDGRGALEPSSNLGGSVEPSGSTQSSSSAQPSGSIEPGSNVGPGDSVVPDGVDPSTTGGTGPLGVGVSSRGHSSSPATATTSHPSDAGSPSAKDAGATETPVDAGSGKCHFEYLGDWIRCENAGWPNLEAVETDVLDDCFTACLEREDCTAVTDWLWLDEGLGCSLYLSTCDAPSTGPWQEEDGGKQYLKVCDP